MDKEKVVISQALIDLIQVMKEQQELLTILLEAYPENEHKAAMLASIERTAAATERINSNITGAIVAGAKEVKGEIEK